MQLMMLGDLKIVRHNSQHYRVLFNTKTGTFIRMEDKGFPEPFWCENGPELIDLSITNYCTRECEFCYRQSNHQGKHLPFIDIQRILKQAKDAGVLQIALGGGNPNQHPQFVEILRLIRESGIVPSYTTNGLGLTDKILQATSIYCGAMAVSFYPPYDQEYYLKLFEKITSYGIRLNLHVILKQDTIEMMTEWLSEAPKLFDYLNAIIFLNYKPIGGTKNFLVKDSNKLKVFFEAADKCKKVKIGFDSCSMSGIVQWMKNVRPEFLEPCEAARFSAFISEDLKMYPCSFMVGTDFYGDLHTQSLKDIWLTSKAFQNFRNRIKTNHCEGCQFDVVCKGGCQFLNEINMCE